MTHCLAGKIGGVSEIAVGQVRNEEHEDGHCDETHIGRQERKVPDRCENNCNRRVLHLGDDVDF